MMTKVLVAIFAGLFYAGQSNMPALADDADVDAGFVTSAIGAHELGQIRGGMAIPNLREIIVIGLGSDETVESVIPELSGIVVLAGIPEAASGVSEALITTAAGVKATASGISEALITTAAGVKETIGQIAAGVRTLRSTALQQGRALLDSD